MADITAKYVRFTAPAPNVVNFSAANGNQRKLTALPVDVIKRLIDQGARVVELKEVKDAETKEVTGYEEVVLTKENYASDNGALVVPEGMTVTVDIDKEVADRHAAEWEAKLEAIGQEIKKEQDEKQEEFFPTQEGEDEEPGVITGGGENPVNPPPENPDIPIP